jgi:CRISPR system Cascade subunit CasA
MVAFRARPRAQPGQDPNPPLGFQADRALWRDSLALVQSVGADATRPKTFDWLARLAADGIISMTRKLPLDALGLAADRAKLLFWRHERLTLPLPYLDERAATGGRLRTALGGALDLAESAGRLMGNGFVPATIGGKTMNVPSPFRVLAQELIGQNGPVEEFVRHLAPGRVYWAELEGPFRRLLERLPEDVTEEDGRPVYGSAELPIWREAVRRAAGRAFESATRGLEQTARTFRAVSLAERELRFRLRELLGAPTAAPVAAAPAGGDRG